MRTPTSIATIALAVLLLSGCVPQPSTVTPTPDASSTPVFASDEEALAAATAAYAAYLAMSDLILNDGGSDPDRIDSVVAGDDLIASEKAGFAEFRANGFRSTGRTVFKNVIVQRVAPMSRNGLDVVRVYLCSDVTGVDVLDESGTSVVSTTRPSRTGFEIGFDLIGPSDNSLIVSSKAVWGTDELCA